jgi:hypothetical protein
MDWNKLQEEARALLPSRELEPSSCWVGVLHHDKDLSECLTQNDFLWMIGRGVSFQSFYHTLSAILTCMQRTCLQKIHDNYGKRFNITDFDIQFRNALVDYQNTISTIQDLNDNLVLFMAVLGDKTSDVLEPTNSVASHTTLETSTLGTDMKNYGPSKILPYSSTLISLESAEICVEKQSQQIREMFSIPPHRDPIDNSFPIDHSENRYNVSSRSVEELPTDYFLQNIIDQGSPDVLEAGIAESLGFLATLKHCFAQHTFPSGNT